MAHKNHAHRSSHTTHTVPSEEDAAVAAVLARAAALDVRLPVRLHGVALPAALAPPPLLAVLPREVLLDPGQIPQRPCRVVVDAGGLGADVHALARRCRRRTMGGSSAGGASRGGCAPGGAAAGSGRAGSPCCRSRTRTGSSPPASAATARSPPRRALRLINLCGVSERKNS